MTQETLFPEEREEAEEVEYTVENVNPRSHAVRDIRMSVQRAIRLDIALGILLAEAKTVDKLSSDPWGAYWLLTKAPLVEAVRMVRKEQWPWVVSHWYTGGLRESIEQGKANLPASVVEKIEKDAKAEYEKRT